MQERLSVRRGMHRLLKDLPQRGGLCENWHRAGFSVAAIAVVLSACGAYAPPAPPPVRTPSQVSASVGKTWDAVIDAFAERNIPIRTMERASGFIATDQLGASYGDTLYADCGRSLVLIKAPTYATYNVVVRGDSLKSTVRVTIRWSRFESNSGASYTFECSTKGVWESQFETAIKGRAEGQSVAPTLAQRAVTTEIRSASNTNRIVGFSLMGLAIIGWIALAIADK